LKPFLRFISINVFFYSVTNVANCFIISTVEMEEG
jgi:hypothetical protein